MGVSLKKSEVLQAEFLEELRSIADWWLDNTIDDEHGGFIGEITATNDIKPLADKGVILNTRILWFFSEAALFVDSARYAAAADKAYRYLVDHFIDHEHGGVFWMLDYQGKVVNDRKQIYAQAFAIYGLSAYYKLTKNEGALKKARAIFSLLEAHGKDSLHTGYFEAFSKTWGELDDVRLSPKDLNSPKSMNTHLHILEAYTALQLAAPAPRVEQAISHCLELFDAFIIDKQTAHLRMFQDHDWSDLSNHYSYGHDIECSWLMWEAVESLHSEAHRARYKDTILALSRSCLEQGLGPYGEVFDAYCLESEQVIEERVWWVQAEALVGFLNAYVLTHDEKYRQAAENVWEFTKTYHKDTTYGEWTWLSKLDAPKLGDCKMGPWKAPYHNGRAMMEAIKLLRKE